MATLQYDVVEVKEVTQDKDGGFHITGEDGWSLWLDAQQAKAITPKVGMAMERYGGIGHVIRGVCLDGVTMFFRGELQIKREHEKWVADRREGYRKDYAELMQKIKGEPTRKTADISGMGGGYERACQLMLFAGLEFLKGQPGFIWDYKEYKGVYGIAWSDSPQAKALDAEMMKAVDNDCSGAMHQAVINHLRFIHKNGFEKWLADMRPERLYTYPADLPAPTF